MYVAKAWALCIVQGPPLEVPNPNRRSHHCNVTHLHDSLRGAPLASRAVRSHDGGVRHTVGLQPHRVHLLPHPPRPLPVTPLRVLGHKNVVVHHLPAPEHIMQSAGRRSPPNPTQRCSDGVEDEELKKRWVK
jgi:hypothetical protein